VALNRNITIQAFVWNEGEKPVELHTDEQDFEPLQRELMVQLDTKDFGKITRIYSANDHIEGGELTVLYRAFTDEYRGRILVSGIDEAELNDSYQHFKTFCAQKVFSPAELYALKPVRVDYGSWHTVNVHLSNDVDYFDIDLDAVEATQRMETRSIVDHDSDGRRGWTLQTVWFDKKPVMVVNSSGRDGDEYHDRWITDGDIFGELVAFLRTFTPQTEKAGFVKASDKIPAMTEFYDASIHDFYDVEAQEPRKK
jgi:hypothetical protein